MPGQLVLPFGVTPGQAREDFIAAPCNEQALRFIERWPDWPARAAAIYGPAGCGKSHLASLWQLTAQGAGIAAADLSVLVPASLREIAIVVEDIDSSAPSHERDSVLMALFERPSLSLLFTGQTPPPQWAVAIGDLRSRFDALIAFPMWELDETFLAALIRKHFLDRQLDVSDAAVKSIVTHVERTPQAVADFVARADAKALSEKRAISEKLVLELVSIEGG